MIFINRDWNLDLISDSEYVMPRNHLTSLILIFLNSDTVLSIILSPFIIQYYYEGQHNSIYEKCFVNTKALYKMLNVNELNLFQLKYLQTEMCMLN